MVHQITSLLEYTKPEEVQKRKAEEEKEKAAGLSERIEYEE